MEYANAASVAAITVICYLVAIKVRATQVDNKYIPVICGAPDWHASDKALAKLIDLCVDICKRNGIPSLNYTGDAGGNLPRHNMFAAAACPGPYLQRESGNTRIRRY